MSTQACTGTRKLVGGQDECGVTSTGNCIPAEVLRAGGNFDDKVSKATYLL
jgi:hypothetical protein